MGRRKKRGKRGGKKAHGPRIYGTEQRGDNGGQTLPALIKGRKPAPLVPAPEPASGEGLPIGKAGMWWMLRRVKYGVASLADMEVIRTNALATLKNPEATLREKNVAGEQLRRLAKDIDGVAAKLATEERTLDTHTGSSVGVAMAAALAPDKDDRGGAAVLVKIQVRQG